MKTFRLFSIAALALVMAACSIDDNEILQQPEQQQGKMHFTATIAAPNNGATTRTTVTKDGDNYNVAWAVNDQIALVYEDTNGDRHNDLATVTAVNSGTATISATLSGPVDGSTAVTLVYPYDIVYDTYDDPITGKNYQVDDRYYSQNVTSIEDALPALDWREGSAYFAVGKSEIGLNSSVTMNPQVAIWKLNLTVGGNPFTAVSLDSPTGMASVSGSSVILFVPIPYFNFAQGQGPIEFSATDYNKYYVYSPTGSVTLTGGKIYESTLALTELLYSTLTVGSNNEYIYHTDGETWKDAIERHRIKNNAWIIDEGRVKSSWNGQYLKNADGTAYINPTTAVDPSATYSWGD